MMLAARQALFVSVAILFLAGCSVPTPQPPTLLPSDTPAPARITPSATKAPPTQTPPLPPATKVGPQSISQTLPAPLYFLSDRSGNEQIWRVEVEGGKLTQITDSPYPVTAYDVSRVTGQIAYVSGNVLIISDALGNNSQAIDIKDVEYQQNLSEAAGSIAWSPDGTLLAFAGQNGLWLYFVDGKDLVQLAANPDRVFGMWLRAPHAWSPDGKTILLRMMYNNSDFGEVIYLSTSDAVIHIASGLSVCHDLTWSLDGQSIFASLGVSTVLCPEPGLVRWNLGSNTITPLILSEPMGQKLLAHFVGTAQEGTDGSLYYFYGSSEVPGDELRYGTLTMVRSALDGITQRVALRSDSYSVVLEVLWADDMSLAVVVDGSTSNSARMGAITLLTADNKSPLTLADRGFNLRWGKQE